MTRSVRGGTQRRRPSRRARQRVAIKGSKPATGTPQPYRPQGILDFLYRVFSDATGSEETLSRCLRLIGPVARLLMLVLAIVIAGVTMLLAGIAVAVQVAALSPWTAGSIGLGGTIMATAWIVSRTGRTSDAEPSRNSDQTEPSDEAEPK